MLLKLTCNKENGCMKANFTRLLIFYVIDLKIHCNQITAITCISYNYV
jgi:hypothetical protein